MSETQARPFALAWTSRLALFAILFLLAVRYLNAASLFPRLPLKTGDFSQRAARLPDVREVTFPATDGVKIYGWLCGPDAAPRKVIFCSGNGGYVPLNGERMSQVGRALNAQVLVYDYRGYFLSEGTPTEEGLYRDARGAWLFATQTLKWRGESTFLWGHSLGAAVALALAADLCSSDSRGKEQFGQGPVAKPAALILESPFLSVSEMARFRMGFLGVPHWLVYARLDNLARAAELSLPALVMHGTEDEIIPFEMGVRLHAALPQATAGLWLEGGKHNSLWASHKEAMTRTIENFMSDNAK